MLPLIFIMLFVGLEVAQACVIHGSLSSAAHKAARDLAIVYWKNADVATDRGLQDAMVLDRVRMQNVVNDSRQFGQIVFNTEGDPATVTVTVIATMQIKHFVLPIIGGFTDTIRARSVAGPIGVIRQLPENACFPLAVSWDGVPKKDSTW